MATPLPSSSKIELAMRCQLPWHGLMMPWPKQQQTKAAERGTDVHDVAEKHTDGNRPEHDYTRATTVSDAARVAVDELTAGGMFVAEQPVAYDPIAHTAKWLPKLDGQRRSYKGSGPDDLVGTIDLLVVRPGEVVVIDHKTGRKARERSAYDTWQLRMLAVAVSRLFGADSVTVALVHVEDGDFRVDQVTFHPWDLDCFAKELREMVNTIRTNAATAKPGPHCWGMYCPIRLTCPETKAALSRLEDDAKWRLPVLAPIENDQDARAWYAAIKQIDHFAEEYVRRARNELEMYVKRRPLHLGDGVWLGEQEQSKDSIDATDPETQRIIAEAVGPEVIKHKVTVTKDAIEAAAKQQQAKRGEGIKRVRRLYDRLRERGAMTTSTYCRVTEFRRKDVVDTDGYELEGPNGAASGGV